MFCCTLLYVHSSIAIILMGKRELIALLNLSFWCLVMVERLFLAVPQGCLQFVIVVFPDHTHLLFKPSKAVLLLWIINVISALCLLCFHTRLFTCLVVTCWERADLLALHRALFLQNGGIYRNHSTDVPDLYLYKSHKVLYRIEWENYIKSDNKHIFFF